MKKNQFKLALYGNYNHAAETILIAAARSNGGEINLSLEQLKSLGMGAVKTFQENDGTNIEIIENKLHVDAKTKAGSYETVFVVEMVEVFEMSETNLEEN